jgi:ribonuclease HII
MEPRPEVTVSALAPIEREAREPPGADAAVSLLKLSSLTVAELRGHFPLRLGTPPPPGLIDALFCDARAQVRALGRSLRAQQAARAAEAERLQRMLRFEREIWGSGHLHIAGVDEAGVGPLAGAVVAGAAILPRGYALEGLDDSKKVASEARRRELAAAIRRDAVAWAVGQASVEEIDRLNIYHASLLAMHRAVAALSVRPDFVLVDARTIPALEAPQRGIVQGDAQSLSIAAGAMLAKTTRDTQMHELDARHPGYGFAAHKGYPSPAHLAALRRLGPLPEHRRSFGPVQSVMAASRPAS